MNDDERHLYQVFFRPDEVGREPTSIPAALFNRCRLLLSHSERDYVIVPIHTMQFQAVIEAHEVFFVDNQAYAVRGGEGGKLIVMSWACAGAATRSSLNEPVAIDLVCFHPGVKEIQRRVMAEFPRALARAEQLAAAASTASRRKILPFPASDDSP